MIDSSKSEGNIQPFLSKPTGPTLNASDSFVEMTEKFQQQVTPNQTNLKSKSDENGSCSNKSVSNTSGNTPNNMQKYFKIPKGHLFSFQKDIAGLSSLRKGAPSFTTPEHPLSVNPKNPCPPQITNSFDDVPSRPDLDRNKQKLSSRTTSLLSKSTQNLSSCIKEDTNEWEDDIETPRKSLNTEVLPYQRVTDSSDKDEFKADVLDIDSSGSDLDFLNEDHPQEEPRGDLEEIIKSASDLTRNRRDQFFQSLNSINITDTMDKEDQVNLYQPEETKGNHPEKAFEDGDCSFLSKIKRKSQARYIREHPSQLIEKMKKKQVPNIYKQQLLGVGKTTETFQTSAPGFYPKKESKRSKPNTPIKKKKSFRDLLRTKKKKREHEKVIQIDLRPKKRSKVPDFNEKIKAWNKMARAGAGVRWGFLCF